MNVLTTKVGNAILRVVVASVMSASVNKIVKTITDHVEIRVK